MMKFTTPFTAIAFLLLVSVARASNWTSPDGNVGLDIPADGSLVQMKNPPTPATAVWETPDRSARVIFLTMPNPGNTVLYAKDLEQGTLNAFPGGSIDSSTQDTQNGVTFFTISGTDKTKKLHFQQELMSFNGTNYKVMAAGPGVIASDPRLEAVFQSITILKPVTDVPARQLSSYELGRLTGEIGVGVLVVAGLIVLVIRQNSSSKSKSRR